MALPAHHSESRCVRKQNGAGDSATPPPGAVETVACKAARSLLLWHHRCGSERRSFATGTRRWCWTKRAAARHDQGSALCIAKCIVTCLPSSNSRQAGIAFSGVRSYRESESACDGEEMPHRWHNRARAACAASTLATVHLYYLPKNVSMMLFLFAGCLPTCFVSKVIVTSPFEFIRDLI